MCCHLLLGYFATSHLIHDVGKEILSGLFGVEPCLNLSTAIHRVLFSYR